MKRAALSLAAALAFVPIATASPETDFPHRDWGQVATLDMTLSNATTCVAQGIARRFARAMPVPVENGSDIDAGPGGGLFGVSHDPWLRLRVRQEGANVTLRVSYRHPISQTKVGKEVERLRKRCLRIRSIVPATE